MTFRISIVEPNFHGHHFSYVRHIVNAALELKTSVSLYITKSGFESPEFNYYLSEFVPQIRIRPILSSVRSGRVRHYTDTCNAIQDSLKDFSSDCLIYPTADFSGVGVGLLRILGKNILRSAPYSECMLTKIGAAYGRSQSYVHDLLEIFGLRASNWSKIGLIDVVAYQFLNGNHQQLSNRIRLYPDPIYRSEQKLTKIQGRKALGIPIDAYYFVCPGVIRSGKGVEQLIDAYLKLPEFLSTRLLIAGPVRQDVRKLLERENISRARCDGRIIVLDRILNEDELGSVISAGDITCCTYPKQNHPSSIAVKSLAYNRPVLYADSYWLGYMGSRFKMGWQVNVADIEEYSNTMLDCVDKTESWVRCSAAERLVSFQSVANFQRSWNDSFRTQIEGKEVSNALSWDEVEGELRSAADIETICNKQDNDLRVHPLS